MWGTGTLTQEQVYFMKGQMHSIRVLKGLPAEVQRSIEALKASAEE